MEDIEQLRAWFLERRRLFPWREDKTPYAVLVSEVMLQQTQASRVLLFFKRWMEQFPTLEALAGASLDVVYKAWEGLGYYSRARALHNIAHLVVERHGGKIPSQYDELLALKGIGTYTAHALLAFAFNKNCAAVDANVCRVVARLYSISADVSKEKTKREIQLLAEKLIPEVRGYEIAEALIELGATVCTPRNPLCSECPLRKRCQAHALGIVCRIPEKGKKISYEKIYRSVAVIESRGELLVRQASSGEIMAGLYEFPYFDCPPGSVSDEGLKGRAEDALQLDLHLQYRLRGHSQSYTRFRVSLYPVVFHADRTDVQGYQWKSLQEIQQLAFSSGHKKVLVDYLKHRAVLDIYSRL